MKWLGIKFKEYAGQKNISLTEIGKRIGVTRQTVNDWVNGQIPKGNHLLALARVLGVSPIYFFEESNNSSIVVPVHRPRKTAKLTKELQEASMKMAEEHEIFFKNINSTEMVQTMRGNDWDKTIEIANELRIRVQRNDIFPINFEQTFRLLNQLGIYVIFQSFPDKIKSYAFYTRICDHRVVFVNISTNELDLIFPLLHEAIHAIRDDAKEQMEYDEDEENLCDHIAGYIQFTDEYINLIFQAVHDRSAASQINILKDNARKYSHAIHGVVKRIKNLHPEYDLHVGGADTNLRKEFQTLGEIFKSKEDVADYINFMYALTPRFVNEIKMQIDDLTDRKLAQLLNIESTQDVRQIRGYLKKTADKES